MIRGVLSVALAAGITWLLLFHVPVPDLAPDDPGQGQLAPVTVEFAGAPAPREALSAPDAADPEPAPDEVATPEPPADPPPAPPEDTADPVAEAVPAPPESGSRDAEPEGQADARASEAPAVDAAAALAEEIERVQENEELLELAASEIRGDAKPGFSTVLLSAPEDQLDIARAFGERLILVPYAAFDEEDAGRGHHVLDIRSTPRVQRVAGTPELGAFGRYRDLLQYEFKRLPAPLQDLRMTVIRSDQIAYFAALIPANEWALVIDRRRAALAALQLAPEEVEQVQMRYVRAGRSAFDIRVSAIVTADGRRLTP